MRRKPASGLVMSKERKQRMGGRDIFERELLSHISDEEREEKRDAYISRHTSSSLIQKLHLHSVSQKKETHRG